MHFFYLFLFIFLSVVDSKDRISCNYCQKKITKKFIEHKKNKYHPICYKNHIQLRCNYCNKIIDGTYNILDDSNFHPNCYKNNILEKCKVCSLPIETEYINDNWGNSFHKKHTEYLPFCESCNRIISKGITNGGYEINGKRNICFLCWNSIVTNKSNIPSIYKDVALKLKNIGINLPKKIPITLVNTRDDLKKISKIRLGSIQGYTKYEVETLGDRIVTEDYNIYILSHLHKINFRAVLAHELLHVYLFKNKLDLPLNLTEGFCNLGSQLIYKEDIGKISELKLKAMYEDNDPVYGKGFIKMNKILTTRGWDGVIKFLQQKSK